MTEATPRSKSKEHAQIFLGLKRTRPGFFIVLYDKSSNPQTEAVQRPSKEKFEGKLIALFLYQKNGLKEKLSGLWLSKTFGDPTHGKPLMSEVPTSSRIRARVISSCVGSPWNEAKSIKISLQSFNKFVGPLCETKKSSVEFSEKNRPL